MTFDEANRIIKDMRKNKKSALNDDPKLRDKANSAFGISPEISICENCNDSCKHVESCMKKKTWGIAYCNFYEKEDYND